ncbi:MAG: FAD-dependent oxidoreductase, partial [Pseudomonadota bacterium]
TDPVPEFHDLDTELPVIRDDRLVSGYIRMEQKKGLIGIYEKENPNTVWEDHCPWEAENELFAPDYDRIMPYLENALERMPIFAELGISRDVHGAISHPPDGNPLIGPVHGAPGYWCACGTQIGIGWGPGLTRELARWMVHGAADINMREFDPRRFGDYATPDWQILKAKEDYCLRHEIPYPHFNRLEGRPVKPSPLYERLKGKGAVFEEVWGHERARWFARDGVAQEDHYSFRKTVVDDLVAEECRAVRERVGLMDVTAFTKIEVSGEGASDLLEPLIANRLPKKQGGIILTHMLNRAGRIEIELTIVKLAENRYYLVCAAFFEDRLADLLDAALATTDTGEMPTHYRRLSDNWSALSLNGPFARHVLSKCTAAPLDNASFHWLTAQEIEVGGHKLWAFRMSYAGELGWEFHMPNDAAIDVYEALMEAGKPFDIRDYGSFAMNALRMEKAFPGAGELTNEVTLPEARVMRFVKMEKDFVGKEATFAGAPRWICTYLAIETDGHIFGHGGEAVELNGEIVGATASVAYGPTVGKVLAFAYLAPHATASGTALEVFIHGTKRAAKVLGEAAYDPNSERPRTDAPAEVAAQ